MQSEQVKAHPIHAFAADFIRDIDRYQDVRSEQLAEAFRKTYGLPPFPRLRHLELVCDELGIGLDRMPEGLSAEGLNISTRETTQIYLRGDLNRRRLETTLCHELREVLENAFKRVKPEYQGLATHDNGAMNSESDRFAGYLLMQSEESWSLFEEVGYNPVEFAYRTRRSLPSVVLRMRQLFSTKGERGPVGGVWLFEAPWALVEAEASTVDDLRVVYSAKLSGFSQGKGMQPGLQQQRLAFPVNRSSIRDFPEVWGAVGEDETRVWGLGGFDLFGERDFICIAQPLSYGYWSQPWRVLLTAIRNDCRDLVAPWLMTLNFA